MQNVSRQTGTIHGTYRGVMYAGFWCGSFREKDSFKKFAIDRKDNIKTDLKRNACEGIR